jgi:transposase
VDEGGKPLDFLVTEGNRHDITQAKTLLAPVLKPGLYVLADRGYLSTELFDYIVNAFAVAVIPPKSNSKEPWEYDKERYKNRNQIERFFNRLKQFRRIATRYDKRARSYLAFVLLAAALLLMPKWSPILV